MTQPPTFDDKLGDWLEDGPTAAPRQVLDTVIAAVPSIPQRRGAWRAPWRAAPMLGLARLVAGVAIVVGLAVGALLFVNRPGPGVVGGAGSPSPVAVVPATPAATPSATSVATPVASPAIQITECAPAQLAARITLWEGAAGHRTAHVELRNTGTGACTISAVDRPQLVDGHGLTLVNGPAPASPDPRLTIAPGGLLKTLVQDGNYCGQPPAAPVSVAFVLASGSRIVAAPFSPTDATVPPCNGPGMPADISMQPWAP
jgi:hypothetical protein